MHFSVSFQYTLLYMYVHHEMPTDSVLLLLKSCIYSFYPGKKHVDWCFALSRYPMFTTSYVSSRVRT
jgi:hypothetical protein